MIEPVSNLIFAIALGCLVFIRCNTILVYFQQEEYDSSRFFTAWREVRLFDVLASSVFIFAMLAGWLLSGTPVALLVLSLAFLYIAWRERSYQFKKPLVVTERLKRIRNLCWIALAVLVALCMFYKPVTVLVLQLIPIVVMLANACLLPAQAKINSGFVQEAKARVKESSAVRIGITGSFGKTTVKHILAELLDVSGPVFFSKGSINTELGLTRHIRQRLQPAHQYFIAEMGAYQLGSINRLCKFVEPQYGMVTAVGAAHAERFGGIETTARAKAELAQWICDSGTTVVVTEDVMKNAPFQALREASPEKFIVVGLGDRSDVKIVSSILKNGAWHIELQLPDASSIAYQIPLMGSHNIMNSALCIALVNAIDPSIASRLPDVTSGLQQVSHRLEFKEFPGLPAILDDAYNSNEQGFINAVEVLRQLADERGGKAVMITPGIAELGDEHDEVHRRLGQHSITLCDFIIVVNPERIGSFVQAAGGESLQVRLVPSLDAARQLLAQFDLGKNDIVLYENDLPDLLEERRML